MWPRACSPAGTRARRGRQLGLRAAQARGAGARAPPATGHPGPPIATWTAEFKGQLSTQNGAYCYPLTICDGYSRYLLVCHGLPSVETASARRVLEQLFRTYELPTRIRSDNGLSFATSALGRLSALSAWWIKLGITPELTGPARRSRTGSTSGCAARSRLRPRSGQGHDPSATALLRRIHARVQCQAPHEALANATPRIATLYRPAGIPADWRIRSTRGTFRCAT